LSITFDTGKTYPIVFVAVCSMEKIKHGTAEGTGIIGEGVSGFSGPAWGQGSGQNHIDIRLGSEGFRIGLQSDKGHFRSPVL
jgi:hypothetical protein